MAAKYEYPADLNNNAYETKDFNNLIQSLQLELVSYEEVWKRLKRALAAERASLPESVEKTLQTQLDMAGPGRGRGWEILLDEINAWKAGE